MYTPLADTQQVAVGSFRDALREEQTAPCDYDREKWLYVPCRFAPYRYILGTRGKHPLICVGINPSTAVPGDLDNTLKSVERIARGNGFDSFTMFNVYAQRATDPDRMDACCNPLLHRENMEAFRYILAESGERPVIWAAWGAIITKRPYLRECLADMIAIAGEYHARWVTAGKRSKAGHPHHPLYLRADSLLEDFDADGYVREGNR